MADSNSKEILGDALRSGAINPEQARTAGLGNWGDRLKKGVSAAGRRAGEV